MDFNQGLLHQTYDLGVISFSEKEIILFATINDPLNFHIDIETAKKSRFKGLVCSGSQAFNYFYVNRWIPLFGKSVVAGLSLNNWHFLSPIYANDVLHGTCHIQKLKSTKIQNEWVVQWNFEFQLKNKRLAQELELTILHNSIKS